MGRADLTMGKPAALVETLKIVLTHTDATHGKLDINVGEGDGIGAVPCAILPAENSARFNLHLRLVAERTANPHISQFLG